MGAKGKVRGVFKSIKYFHINFVIKMFGSSLHPFRKLSVSTVVHCCYEMADRYEGHFPLPFFLDKIKSGPSAPKSTVGH